MGIAEEMETSGNQDLAWKTWMIGGEESKQHKISKEPEDVKHFSILFIVYPHNNKGYTVSTQQLIIMQKRNIHAMYAYSNIDIGGRSGGGVVGLQPPPNPILKP